MNIDNLTLYYRKAINILFLKHPTRTCLGVIFGYCMDCLINLFYPSLERLSFINIGSINLVHLIAIGIFLAHLPTFINFVYKKSYGEESIDQILALIENGNFSDDEKRQQYRNLINKVFEDACKDDQFKKSLDRG